MAETNPPTFSSDLVRRAFRRQLLMGALALLLLIFSSSVLLMELHLNEGVKTRYQEALSIAGRALDVHRLAAQLSSERLRLQADPAAAVAATHGSAQQRRQRQADLERIREGLQSLRGLA
jgi:hypothetical protein